MATIEAPAAGKEPVRPGGARTVIIDPERWRRFFWKRRIALVAVGPMMTPERCTGWASVIAAKGRAGLYALDDLAVALDLRVDDVIEAVGADCERARSAVYL